MPADAVVRNWLPGEFAERLGAALEMMAGTRPAMACEAAVGSPVDGLTWWQPLVSVPGAVWLTAAESDVAAIGGYLLRTAGLGETDPDSVKSTYLEILSQALSGLAQTISGKLNREVTVENGRERDIAELGEASNIYWMRATLTLPDQAAVLHIGFEQTLLDTLSAPERRESAIEAGQPAISPASPGALTSRTFDLLLDVELPVSVSFGRAQVQLKDVLKLTTGSIVELNRSIAEPVEVIVNNCVIARGEVVVVEGNFGVRIQQVISRQERLRTLQ